ncbi:MAG: hypothetical protein ACRD5L_13780, partial [Bryobacteraceae bacterium]
SVERFAPLDAASRSAAAKFAAARDALLGPVLAAPPAQGDAALVFARTPGPNGPMGDFGYNYFTAKYGAARAAKIALLSYQGLRGNGEEYSYEVLNFVDGHRNIQQIRDAVSAEYGPVPLPAVLEYLKALESIGAIHVAS